MSSRILCCASERFLQHPESNEAWKNRVAGVRSEKSYRDYDAINGESTEFERNIFPGFTTLQLCGKISDLLSYLGTPATFTGRILFMSMFNDISCDRKDNKDECLANAGVVKVLAKKDLELVNGLALDQGSEKKWYSSENSPQGAWDNIAEQMLLLEFAESGHPTFRATTPLSRCILKSKGRGKLSIHFAADGDTIDTIYRIILSVNQLKCLRSSGSCM